MNIKRTTIIPDKTKKGIIIESVIAEIVLIPNEKGEKEVVFYRLEEEELSSCTKEYLLGKIGKTRGKFGIKNKSDNSYNICKHFSPIIIGNKEYASCEYCRLSHNCLQYIKNIRRS